MGIINNKGFAIIETLLLIIALTLIGGVGYYVYSSNKNTDSIQSAGTKDSVSLSKSKKSPRASTVTLGGSYYSFTAPSGWQAVGDDLDAQDTYKGPDGDSLTVGVDQRYNRPTADFVWEAKNVTANGIEIGGKSTGCHPEHSNNSPAAYDTFEDFVYTCNASTTSTTVAVFFRAGGGEVPVGQHKYTLQYTVPKKPDANISGLEALLTGFKAK